MTFGLLIDWVSSAYHQQIWSGIQAYCREHGVNLLTLVTGRPGSPFRWEQMRNQLLEFVDGPQFDGVLLMTATLSNHLNQDQFRQLLDRVAPTPVVSVGAELPGIPGIEVDNGTGFRELLGHLATVHGHRRFAWAGGPLENRDSRERHRILVEFLESSGLEVNPNRFVEGPFGMAWGRTAVNLLVPDARPDFDVLICANDEIALGALDALSEKGLQVPGDLAVTGFDDVMTSGLAALTTVRQPLVRLGWKSAEALFRSLGNQSLGMTRLDSQAVVRQSCGCLSPAARAAQVEPRSVADDSFEVLVRVEGERLLEELSADGLPGGFARSLRDRFLAAWEVQDSRVFLHGVQLVLKEMADRELSPDHLHYPLSVLRRWVLQATEPAVRRSFTEATIHQARILATEVLHSQAVQKETRQLLLKDLLSDLNERLIYSKDFADQAEIMLSFFPQLGIGKFQLSLYDDPAKPMSSAHLVLTEQGRLPEARGYNPKQLFAPGWAPSGSWSYVAEALFDRNAPLGFFLLDSQGNHDLLAVFDQLCERVGRGIETVRRIQALEDQVAARTRELQAALARVEASNHKLKDMALRDELTGLYNRRGFLTLSEHLHAAHQRNRRPLVLFFGDLDGLKRVNDTWGHEAGDEAIRTCARLLSEAFRADDVVARLGGDEFAILAPDCTPEVAPSLAARASASVDSAGEGRFGLSVGWVVIDAGSGRPLGEWMREADKNLYREKLARKNR